MEDDTRYPPYPEMPGTPASTPPPRPAFTPSPAPEPPPPPKARARRPKKAKAKARPKARARAKARRPRKAAGKARARQTARRGRKGKCGLAPSPLSLSLSKAQHSAPRCGADEAHQRSIAQAGHTARLERVTS